jgi:hypothetical protein
VAALAGLIPLAHGGTVGLVTEIGTAVAFAVLLGWAAWKSRHGGDKENDGGRSNERPP